MPQTQHPHDSVAAEYVRAIAHAKAHTHRPEICPEEHHYWVTMYRQLVIDYNRLYRGDAE